MKDNYGDKIEVKAETDLMHNAGVYLAVEDQFSASRSGAFLSPSKARKLAAKLLKAADQAEANGG